MTNKELIAELSKRLGWTQGEVSTALDATVSVIKTNLANINTITVQGFGVLETRKMQERISVNPISQKRFLVPPKIVPAFRPSQAIKDQLKNLRVDE